MMNKPSTELRALLAGAVIVLAGLWAYANSFSGPFVFDDFPSVLHNPTIRHLWPIWDALQPPRNGAAVEGRPIANLTLAINYAAGGLKPWGYHAVNLGIHLLAGLALFGLVRQTLKGRGQVAKVDLRRGGQLLQPDPLAFAFAVALLWTLHPLQTESVTFISNRAECLMGLFYLLTLYCLSKGGRPSPTPSLWLGLSVASCLLGMATKEVMVSAPLVVLLYDRTFLAGSFREAWCRRRAYYLCLAATWILLGSLVASMGGSRGKAAGFDSFITPWSYALTQCKAVVHYLTLAFWPRSLVFDYGFSVVNAPGEVVVQALILFVLLAATLLSLRFRPALGFLGAWFFLILAPSSSILPLTSQTMAEHRMYLPLAAVIALAVGVAWGQVAKLDLRRGRQVLQSGPILVVVAVLAVGLGFATHRRNEVYQSEVGLWGDTARKCPDSIRAHFNLGMAYDEAGRRPDGRDEYFKVVLLDPFNADAHFRLADDLAIEGRMGEAIAHFQEAAFLKPANPEIHRNYGNALEAVGRGNEAAAQFAEANRLQGVPGAAFSTSDSR